MNARGVRQNKYNARKTPYNGRTYDSLAEATYARGLDMKLAAGYVRSWTPQFRVPIHVNDQKICTYVADFWIEYNDGRIELIDVKGVSTPVFKLKKKLLEATYLRDNPEIVFRIVNCK